MKVKLWGTRGSLATPGFETEHYGGNTSCVEVHGNDGTVLVLDAGTGIRQLGVTLNNSVQRVDLLLTHLHMDHIQGLGFFAPIYNPNIEVHIWGPASTTMTLQGRLARYLSPQLFPIRLRELPCKLVLHEVPDEDFEVGEFRITSKLVCHPGPTVGYRIASPQAAMAYLPDHEPALGLRHFPMSPEWTSGYAIAENVDLLIHDAQYTREEYDAHIGWGHSSLDHALAYAALVHAKLLVLYHHDPAHNDELIEQISMAAIGREHPTFPVIAAAEGQTFVLGPK